MHASKGYERIEHPCLPEEEEKTVESYVEEAA
jgi:hypothetical protein